MVQPLSDSQWTANPPPSVLPRVAVAAPVASYPQPNSWSATNSVMMPGHHQQGSVIIDSQQAPGSQDSSGQFRFLPGQRFSQDSQSTPSLSNRSVPRFLEEAWANSEPQQQGSGQGPPMPPPPPPPPPGAVLLHETSDTCTSADLVMSTGLFFTQQRNVVKASDSSTAHANLFTHLREACNTLSIGRMWTAW